MSSEALIAVVDDDGGVRRALSRLLRSLAFEPVAFATGEDFLASLPIRRPMCAVLDLHLPGLRGTDVLARLGDGGFDIPVIVITGLDEPGMRERCLQAGAGAYLRKPIGRSDIAEAIKSLMTPS